MMKSLENGIDLGAGLLIMVLAMSTAFSGLKIYSNTQLNHELVDKNTTGHEAHLLASDDLVNTSIEDLAITLIASSVNVDNVRAITVKIIPAANLDAPEQLEVVTNFLPRYSSALDTLNDAINDYITTSFPGTTYAQHLAAGKIKCFVTEQQSGVTAYILIQ